MTKSEGGIPLTVTQGSRSGSCGFRPIGEVIGDKGKCDMITKAQDPRRQGQMPLRGVHNNRASKHVS